MTAGITGYGDGVAAFVAACEAVDFEAMQAPTRHLLPAAPARILDIGAGSGRDAAAFAALGHSVVAVEPMSAFLSAAQALHPASAIRWVTDDLPDLASLSADPPFDYIQALAVWHHLSPDERPRALRRLSGLLTHGGVLALSLRHGPAGMGRHVFPIDADISIRTAAAAGLQVKLHLPDRPSHGPGKADVVWTRLAFGRV